MNQYGRLIGQYRYGVPAVFILRLAMLLAVAMVLTACGVLGNRPIDAVPPALSSERLAAVSSVAGLNIQSGMIFTDNDDAFDIKLQLIQQATTSVDLAYYIYADDYSSSVLSRALLAATARGVNIRMLLDYHSHYKNLDQFLMLEDMGNRGPGSLNVRFYNQPTDNIIKDAMYMTLSCEQTADKSLCADEKNNKVNRWFANEEERRTGINNSPDPVYARAGLFLSGLYGKDPNVMAMAVTEGQNIDIESLQSGAGASSSDDLDKLKQLAQLYWRANYGGGLDKIVNRIKLSAAFALFGDQVNPVYDNFATYLPVERDKATEAQARKDWQHLTDFLHHKLLWVDQKHWVIGGRNVEDSYHMNASKLSAKYTFMDTDAYFNVSAGGAGITTTFEMLWDFDAMVVDLDTIRRQAPNDLLVNGQIAKTQCEGTEALGKDTHAACINRALLSENQRSPMDRIERQYARLVDNANAYEARYEPRPSAARSRQFDIAEGANISYVENLPFDRVALASPPASQRSVDNAFRQFGAENGSELTSGKSIHALWQSALADVCQQATADLPQQVYVHNAYFFMPSNLLSQVAQMIDGRQPCQHVTIIVLTNSIETTDLNVVNVLARHSMKALFEHYARHVGHGARLQYHEYHASENGQTDGSLSLHSKIMMFGDTIFVGSANADLRSYMMDTNNGVFIRNADQTVRAYRDWMNNLLEKPDRTQLVNSYYVENDRAALLEEGDVLVDTLMAKYRAERFVTDESQTQDIKIKLRQASDAAYQLSKEIVRDHQASRKAQAKFNALFMLI